MIKKHNNFSKMASTLTLSLILLVGCSTVIEPEKDTALLGSKVKPKNDVSTEISNEDKSTELTADESFEIASKTVKDYFDFDANKKSFDPNTIIDMGHYWIVNVSNSNGGFELRISLEDKQPFLISGSASASKKLVEEFKKVKNVKDIDTTEYLDYYYSKKSISKEESLKIAEEFIKSSPLKDMNLSFSESESFYELKYDSPEKEFYVFAYLKGDKDPENPQKIVFIKINTFLKEVSEVSF